jgi:DNA-binding LacI/PurR family transcriptional regulator
MELLNRPRRPRAVFAANDMMAIGAMRAIREKGLRVPEDVALVGGDDIPLAHYVCPALTTIRQPMDVIGSMAVQMLLDHIAKAKESEGPPEPFERVFDTELVVRESCGAKR